MQNYRPTSVLPAVSGVLETWICKRQGALFEKQEVFAPTQHGYRNRKCTICNRVSRVIRKDLRRAGSSGVCGNSLVYDVNQAFDTVMYRLFLQNYTMTGRGTRRTDSWYYTLQKVQEWNNVSSNTQVITMLAVRLPQGSNPWPDTVYIVYQWSPC